MVAYDKSVNLVILGQDTLVDGFVPWDIINEVTSFMAPGYRFSPRYRIGQWDGRKKLFQRRTRMFPAGLTNTVKRALEACDIQVTVDDRREMPPLPELPDRWHQSIHLEGVAFDYPYDYQPKVADAMLRAQRGVAAVATNGGKTEIACLVTAALRVPTLFMVPGKELLHQTAKRFRRRLRLSQDEVGVVGDGIWKPGSWVTVATAATLSRGLKKAKVRDFLDGIDLFFADECFPAGTFVGKRPIEELREGDIVPSFDEKTRSFVQGRVVRRFISRPSSLVRVCFKRHSLVCTPGHPFWTQRGWVPAALLTNDDMVLCSTQEQEVGCDNPVLSMRKEDRKDSKQGQCCLSGLQEIAEEDGDHVVHRVQQGSCTYDQSSTCASKARESVLLQQLQKDVDLSSIFRSHVGDQQTASKSDLKENDRSQSYARPPNQSENEDNSSGYGMAAPNSRRERNRPYSTRTVASEHIGMGDRNSHSYQTVSGIWLPYELQSRRGQRRSESCNRDRWGLSLFPRKTGTRPEEGRSSFWSRVGSVEVLERRRDGTFGEVCPDGLVYNIEVEGTHTYLADGVVVHNCHHAASDTWYKVLRACPAFFRFGLSGTPLKRSDGADLKLVGVTGEIVSEIRNKFLIERGISNEVEIRFLRVDQPKGIPKGTPWDDVYKLGIVENVYRNTELCRRVAEFVDDGKQCVMMVKELEHGRRLDKQLWDFRPGSFVTHQFINGEESSDVRQKALEDFVNGDLKVLIVTSILDQGVDVPNIDVLVPAGGGKSSIKTLQRVGRGLRKGGASDRLIVLETADMTHHYLTDHSLQRMKDYKAEECFEINVI